MQKLSIDIQKFLLKFNISPKTQNFYLLCIFSTLAILHLDIIRNHRLESENLTVYALYWGGILYLLWKNPPIEKSPHLLSSGLGLGLLFFAILRPINLWHLDLILFRFAPLVAGLGVGFLSFGFLGIRHYWRLYCLLLLMLFPYSFINGIFESRLHFNNLTATISAFLLHYLGFGATHFGNLVKLPTGQVEVLYACTGGELIIWLLQIVLLILLVFRNLNFKQWWGLIISAVTVGFFVGCIRVALLAVIVNNKNLFDYWHGQEGATIFMAIGTITFAALCNWILPLDNVSAEQKYSDTLIFIQPKRLLFLITTWVGILLTAIFLLINKQPIYTNIFNNNFTLNNWQQVNSQSLQDNKIEIANTDQFILVDSGQDYSYIQNNQELEIQMRYVINTRGGINPFLIQQNQELKQAAENNIKYVEGIGYYSLYSDGRKAYLSACINSRGGSTVNSSQFMKNRYKYDVNTHRFIPWILGKVTLRDDRCIWTQISLPITEKVANDTYSVLELIWKDNYKKWQSQMADSY